MVDTLIDIGQTRSGSQIGEKALPFLSKIVKTQCIYDHITNDVISYI